MMIKEYSLSVLQKAMNHGLSLDEATPSKFEALHGKVLKIVINPLNVHFFMRFNHQELELLASFEGDVDTVISSSPLGLIRLSLLPASKVRSLFNDNIKMSGDVELGQAVKKIFDEIDIDWEGHLARFTGDVVAYQVGSFVREGLSFQRGIKDSVCHDMTEYLQEELRIFPPREEVSDFFKDIDELSLSVERLAAHVHQLIADSQA